VRSLDATINLSWDRPVGASDTGASARFNIYCSTSPTDLVQQRNRIAENFSGLSFSHTGVTNGQRYYYAVTRVTSGGEGPASLAVSATPQAALPAPPYALRTTSQDGSVLLALTGPTRPGSVSISYNLYRSTVRGSFGNASRIATQIPFVNSYSDANLVNGTIYYYAVTAVANGKESGFSPVVAAAPQAPVAALNSSATQVAAFASPTGVSVESGSGTCIITWNKVADLVLTNADPAGSALPDYVLSWSDTSDILNKATGSADDIAKNLTAVGGTYSYQLSGLNNGTVYYLQLTAAVRGSDGKPVVGRGTPGPMLAVTPSPKTPGIPSGVSAAQGARQVVLTWSKDTSGVPGVNYNVYYATSSPATPAELVSKGTKMSGTVAATSFTHSGLQTGATYYYVVTSVAEGESAPSGIVAVTL
jgi:fibronectin type 3 domain-containing protein